MGGAYRTYEAWDWCLCLFAVLRLFIFLFLFGWFSFFVEKAKGMTTLETLNYFVNNIKVDVRSVLGEDRPLYWIQIIQ
jgi:hypothetical protein